MPPVRIELTTPGYLRSRIRDQCSTTELKRPVFQKMFQVRIIICSLAEVTFCIWIFYKVGKNDGKMFLIA